MSCPPGPDVRYLTPVPALACRRHAPWALSGGERLDQPRLDPAEGRWVPDEVGERGHGLAGEGDEHLVVLDARAPRFEPDGREHRESARSGYTMKASPDGSRVRFMLITGGVIRRFM